MYRTLAAGFAAALLITGLAAAPSSAAPAPPGADDHLTVYTGTVDAEGLAAIVDLGVDRHEIVTSPSDEAGKVQVEVILSGEQAADLNAEGADLAPKSSGAQRRGLQAEQTVFRQYSGPGGIQEELVAQVAAHPGIAELQVIGQTVDGQDITAVRVTKSPGKVKVGSRPAVIYTGAQHAREWITPEMVRRLLDYYVTNYGSDARVTGIVDTTELWFVPVANPDGYDFTFTDGNRQWRKNLRDNNGDGVITSGDGVDLNRNFPTRWGYDNEGSSPSPASETYRGPSPGSEPETQAIDSLFAEVTPEFYVNYHSAAELLLYGLGWQVATPSPDDVIYEAMAGDDANPAIPGYDPDISAELYTTNGEFDTHMQTSFGALGFTPEMSTCETASNAVPDDAWEAADCASVFTFPDDESLIAAEFEKNLPFALAVAESTKDPDDPVSVVGRDTEDFRIDAFSESYGDTQTVAVLAKRSLAKKVVNYSINGGPTVTKDVAEWTGGERYGAENTDYYAEYRAMVTDASPGDSVEVWFSAKKDKDKNSKEKGKKTAVESEHFTYTVVADTGNPVLVIANEDYTGVNPTYPAGVTAPKYADEYVAALDAAGVGADVWDVDAKGVPHDLGVLSHYDGVVWELGDNRLTQDPEDFITDTYLFGPLPDLSVAERQQYLTLAVRDFLNEGGKLALAGETVGYYGLLGSSVSGIYYGLDGAPEEDCVVTADFFSDCLLLADDFTQYWLGAYDRTALDGADGVTGTADPLTGVDALFGGDALADNPIDEIGAFTPTSDVLPVSEFPQFESWAAADYVNASGRILPVEGEWAAVAAHVDDGYQRLMRTFDLTAVSAGDAPTFEAQINFATEFSYDNVIVEVHTVGEDDWTTLPEATGGTDSSVPAECEGGFLLAEHPFLEHYLTPGTPCTATGTTGSWNRFTGSTGGEWAPVSFDLSAYAGQQVELSISYVTDPSSGDIGLLVDDTKLVVGGAVTQAEGFESGLGAWSVPGAPAGSPGNASDFELTQGVGAVVASVATDDSLLFGFGLEQLADPADRAEILGRFVAMLD